MFFSSAPICARENYTVEVDGRWVTYLLEQMGTEAEKHRVPKQYEYTLEVLVEKIQKRIEGGKW